MWFCYRIPAPLVPHVGSQRSQPKHVSIPEQRSLNHIVFIGQHTFPAMRDIRSIYLTHTTHRQPRYTPKSRTFPAMRTWMARCGTRGRSRRGLRARTFPAFAHGVWHSHHSRYRGHSQHSRHSRHSQHREQDPTPGRSGVS